VNTREEIRLICTKNNILCRGVMSSETTHTFSEKQERMMIHGRCVATGVFDACVCVFFEGFCVLCMASVCVCLHKEWYEKVADMF
jgi:hypothetical protein